MFLKRFLQQAEDYTAAIKNGTVAVGGVSPSQYIADGCAVHCTGRSHMGGWHRGEAFQRFVTNMAQYTN